MERFASARVFAWITLAVFCVVSDSSASCPTHIDGHSTDVGFGFAAALPGDLNGDGFRDIVIGATSDGLETYNVPGSAYIYFGGPLYDDVADVVLTGEANGDRFGYSLAGTGDLNGDGYPDLAVGAHLNDSGGIDAGRVYVYFGGPGLDSVPDRVFTGTGDRFFGFSLDGAGDLNADSYRDLVVGAPFTAANAGRAYIYFGGPNFDTVVDRTLSAGSYEQFGTAVKGTGDVNADGIDDLAVSGPYAAKVYLYWSSPALDIGVDRTLLGYSPYGQTLAAGDVNGDGWADVLVGSFGTYQGAGNAWIYFGGPLGDNRADLSFAGPSSSAFSRAIAAGFDLDGDGAKDFLIGAPGWSGPLGRVYFYRGGAQVDAIADRVVETSWESFGCSCALGSDVNGDGSNDVLIGAFQHGLQGRANLGLQPGIGLSRPAPRSIDFGDTTQLCFRVYSRDDRPQSLDFTVRNSVPWAADSAGAIALAPGDSLCINVTCIAPFDDGCTRGNNVTCSVYSAGCADPVATQTTSVSRNFIRPVVTCSGADEGTIVSPGDTLHLEFCVRNANRAPRPIRYSVGSASGWCGSSVSTIDTLPGGDSLCIARTCIVPLDAVCGTERYVSIAARDACPTGLPPDPYDYEYCTQSFTVSGVACAEQSFSGSRDTVVTAGTSSQRRMKWRNCSDAVLTYDYSISDSLGWGQMVTGTATLAPQAESSGLFHFTPPPGVLCAVLDVVKLEVRARTCPTRVFSFTSHVTAQPAASGTARIVLAGDLQDDFGASVVMPGDLNADGVDDFAVGAGVENQSVTGRAYVWFGGPIPHTPPDRTLSGQNHGDAFGSCLAGAGDLNGDGYPDLAVGAFLNDAAGQDAGRVYAYFGGPAFDNIADQIFDGPSAFSDYGQSIAGVGDVNGDGFDDLLVSALVHTEAGRAYVYLGGPALDGEADLVLEGQQPWERFGYQVAAAGDVNGDGWADVLIGAPINQVAGPDAGAVYVYFGGPALDVMPDLSLYGTAGTFGSSLASADVNGDGALDILVGAPHFASSTGRAYVFFGGAKLDSQADLVLESGVRGEKFAWTLSGAGDLDGDGYRDLIVGSNTSNYYDNGRAWIYLGGPRLDSVCDGVLFSAERYGAFGSTLAAGRDVTSDGGADVLIGEPAGRVHLYDTLRPITTEVSGRITETVSYLQIEPTRDLGGAGIRIGYAVGPQPAAVRLELFDVGGRRVRTLAASVHDMGRYELTWDRLDTQGHRAARGVYVLRLRAGNQQVARKVVLTRP